MLKAELFHRSKAHSEFAVQVGTIILCECIILWDVLYIHVYMTMYTVASKGGRETDNGLQRKSEKGEKRGTCLEQYSCESSYDLIWVYMFWVLIFQDSQ